MLATLLIVFREMLEAGLVVGIVLAATEGLAGRMLAIFGGIAAGLCGAGVVAGFADVIAGRGAGRWPGTLHRGRAARRGRNADLPQCLDDAARPKAEC